MTVYTVASTPTGTNSLTVTGTSGSLHPTAGIGLVVQSTDPYVYYVSDNLTSIGSTWTKYGTVTTSSNGLTGGIVISNAAAPSGNDYDEQLTIHGCATGDFNLYGRANTGMSSYYDLEYSGFSPPNFTLHKRNGGPNTAVTIAWYPPVCTEGMTLRMVLRGNQLMVWNGTSWNNYQDNDISSGQPAVGITIDYQTSWISNVQFGAIDTVAPPAINQAQMAATAAPHWVDLQWPAGADNAGGIGLQGYAVYRNGTYFGSTSTPQFRDEAVSPGNSAPYTYTVYPYDLHGNYSTVPATIAVTAPAATQPDQMRTGVRANGAYWGAAGEQIDLLSGNLNFSIPLFKALGRGGWGVTFALSYNSQMWRQDNATWLLGGTWGTAWAGPCKRDRSGPYRTARTRTITF
jgi:hypothetical protein